MMSVFWVLIYFSAVAAGTSVFAVENWRKAFNDLVEDVNLTPKHFEVFYPILDVFVDFLDHEAVSGAKPVLLTDFARFFAYHINCFDNKLNIFYRLVSMGWDGYLDQETRESYINNPNLLIYPDVVRGIYEMIPMDPNDLSQSEYTPLKIALVHASIPVLEFLILEAGADIAGPVVAECLPIIAYNLRHRSRDLIRRILSLLRVKLAETDTPIFRGKLATIFRAETYTRIKELCLEFGVPIKVFDEVELKCRVLSSLPRSETEKS